MRSAPVTPARETAPLNAFFRFIGAAAELGLHSTEPFGSSDGDVQRARAKLRVLGVEEGDRRILAKQLKSQERDLALAFGFVRSQARPVLAGASKPHHRRSGALRPGLRQDVCPC